MFLTNYLMFLSETNFLFVILNVTLFYFVLVRYHFGGSMELNACILLLALMVYL
jgi:hypothetical protein